MVQGYRENIWLESPKVNISVIKMVEIALSVHKCTTKIINSTFVPFLSKK